MFYFKVDQCECVPPLLYCSAKHLKHVAGSIRTFFEQCPLSQRNKMTYQSTTEYVRISLSADVATAHCAGSTIPLSKDVIYRSSLLNQALAEATDQDEVSLSLPKGVLAAWQQGLKLIDIDPGPPTTAESAERRVAAFDHRRKCGSKGMFESIWVRSECPCPPHRNQCVVQRYLLTVT